MTPRARRIAASLTLVAGLLAAWWGCDKLRRTLIRGFFVDGPAGAAPRWEVGPGEPLPAAARVRVALLDGLSADHAAGLPALSQLCARGQELRVDVGFPTVSLPVQHALWTGLTQQQSGLEYRVAQIAEPPAHALPRQVDSLALAESHPEIVHSFGFGSAAPPVPGKDETLDPTWRDAGFPAAALAAVAGAARLVFVHVLRIDEAGHATGAASSEYAAAATWSDELLARLTAAAPPDPATLWLVLADHGHRPAGGHGGAEPEIRRVRACLVGGAVVPGPLRSLHLVDVSRALADALEVASHPEARGRPWSAALADPAEDATLPGPGPLRGAVAAVLAVVGLLSLRTGRKGQVESGARSPARADTALRWLLGAGWLAVAWSSLVAIGGLPTLSNPLVYPPQARDLLYASAPGLAMLPLLHLLAARRGWSAGAVVRAAAGPWAGLTAAALVLCKAPEALLYGVPPLMPGATAAMSTTLAHGRIAALVLAVGAALQCLVAEVRRARAPA